MRSILITGCRRGIGFEIVKQISSLKECPEIIIATVRKAKDAPELMKLAKENPRIKVLELDNNEYHKMDEFARQVEGIVGDKGLNVLFHNAGILTTPKDGKIEELTSQQLLDVLKTNTVGPIMLTKSLLPLLRKASKANSDKPMGSDRAVIAFVSSFLGSHTLNQDRGGFWGYRESKTAINMAALTLKAELANDKIGTMCFHPGWVKTDMGGEGAQVETHDSVQGMLKQLLSFSEENNGTFVSWNGSSIPW